MKNSYDKIIIDDREIGVLKIESNGSIHTFLVDADLIPALQSIGNFSILDKMNPESSPPILHKRNPETNKPRHISLTKIVAILKKSDNPLALALDFTSVLFRAKTIKVIPRPINREPTNCLFENWNFDEEVNSEDVKKKLVGRPKPLWPEEDELYEPPDLLAVASVQTIEGINKIRLANNLPAYTEEEWDRVRNGSKPTTEQGPTPISAELIEPTSLELISTDPRPAPSVDETLRKMISLSEGKKAS